MDVLGAWDDQYETITEDSIDACIGKPTAICCA